MRVFVLIFNAGTDNEGIHSIQVANRNKILMFESEDDATRFGVMLEAQDFPTATVEQMDADDIKEFCQAYDYDWEIIPENGDLVLPPEANVEQTDWQPEDDSPLSTNQFDDADADDTSPTEISDSELDSIRRKLEGLL
ncbi:DUF3110 domain-containing protein [Richelia sinica]|nr:DUF3110 domain-containing protein [Richelia sinica]MBD2664846.1 DUF3110 domain-containing protein [Richelia sinica FACHB-800]